MPENLALDRERLISLIGSMADGVISLNETGKILLYNGAALNILDTHGSIEGKRLDDVCKLMDRDGKDPGFTELITSQKTQYVSRDYTIAYSDGSHANLFISIAPVGAGYGKSGDKGFVVLLRDITHEKSLEEERDEFISVVSHELRTPITITEGNISNAEFIVSKAGGNDQIREALKVAHEQVIFLGELINDLATLSRAERGKLNLEIDNINIHELMQGLAEEYEPQARIKGLELQTKPDPHLELLATSKLYIREILQNFITNAIKYTEKGCVTISANQQDNGVLFEINDTGIGIGKPDQAKIFNKFFRSEDYRTRANSGTGLGLYVTMKLAKLINAKISLNSELNQGSTFSIFVPNLQ